MGPESLGRHAKQCALLAGHAALWWSDPRCACWPRPLQAMCGTCSMPGCRGQHQAVCVLMWEASMLLVPDLQCCTPDQPMDCALTSAVNVLARCWACCRRCTTDAVWWPWGLQQHQRHLGLSPNIKAMLQAKAYTTRVGAGAYPTEIKGSLAETLRKKGGEYGTTTGRPRRVGWLDIPALKYATRCGTPLAWSGASRRVARCLVGEVVVLAPYQVGLLLGKAMYPCG